MYCFFFNEKNFILSCLPLVHITVRLHIIGDTQHPLQSASLPCSVFRDFHRKFLLLTLKTFFTQKRHRNQLIKKSAWNAISIMALVTIKKTYQFPFLHQERRRGEEFFSTDLGCKAPHGTAPLRSCNRHQTRDGRRPHRRGPRGNKREPRQSASHKQQAHSWNLPTGSEQVNVYRLSGPASTHRGIHIQQAAGQQG